MPPKRKAPAGAKSVEAKKGRNDSDSDIGNGLKWECEGEGSLPPLVYLSSDTVAPVDKAIGFDIDWTITATKSGAKFCTGPSDWKWWHESVPKKLKDLHNDGYRVVFFSNQGGIEKKKGTILDVQKRINAIIKEVKIPIFAFFSTGENYYRKPSTGMWDFFADHCNGKKKVNLSQCMFVGDAAGRAKDWSPGKPRDFSCTDRMFAANIGIQFKTPEEFFLNEKPAKFEWRSFDPQQFMKGINNADSKQIEYHSKNPELVILMGYPASGKSTFATKYFTPHGYVHINRDLMGTKCFKKAEEAVASKKSVVIDNTNPDPATRKQYIDLAKKNKLACRCFYLDTPRDIAGHLNYLRQTRTRGKIRRIPDVGFNMYKSKMQPPDSNEGFDCITVINFHPRFDDNEHKQLFMHWNA